MSLKGLLTSGHGIHPIRTMKRARFERRVRRAQRQLQGREESHALDPIATASTRLAAGLAEQIAANPGLTGILALADARGAFAARILLARTAERTLDIQYYIWHHDCTGRLMLKALYEAAERGVRVRLLLDDNGIAGMDDALAALETHPNVAIRLFNPFKFRKLKPIGYITDFSRANRRMHNKSFTADNQATIVGGRNIGDEYFGAGAGTLFTDLDVLAAGQVVPEVSADFDRYWACESAFPIDRIVPSATPDDLRRFVEAASRLESDPEAAGYIKALHESQVIDELFGRKLDLAWNPCELVSDDPSKGLGKATDDELMIFRVMQILGQPKATVDLVSPYFVPTAAGVAAFTDIAARGIEMRVLTNALEATDVAAVHAGYAKRRKALLRGGIKIYEMQRQPSSARRQGGPLGSSSSSLHAKTFSVDQRRVFVGSFNFDPRSARLNTEMGLIVDDRELAVAVDKAFDDEVPITAYEVRLDERGALHWLQWRDGKQVRIDTEPGTGFVKRAVIGLLSLLPIEWLL